MTKEEKRIKLAELLGWKRKYDGTLVFYWVKPNGEQLTEATNRYRQTEQLPDYCNDLNAVREVIQTMSEAQKAILNVNIYSVLRSSIWAWEATPEEMTDAIILTLSQA